MTELGSSKKVSDWIRKKRLRELEVVVQSTDEIYNGKRKLLGSWPKKPKSCI
jgi:hypothetical protein